MIVAAVAKQAEVDSASLRLVTLRGKQWMHETSLGEYRHWLLSLVAHFASRLLAATILPLALLVAKVPATSTMADVKTLFREKGIYSVGALYPSINGEPLREATTVKELRDQVFEDEAGHLVLYTRV